MEIPFLMPKDDKTMKTHGSPEPGNCVSTEAPIVHEVFLACGTSVEDKSILNRPKGAFGPPSTTGS